MAHRHLTTDRLVLRPFAAGDAGAVARLIGDLAVARWLTHVPHPYTEADALDFFERSASDAATYAVTKGGQLIGAVSLRSELGYWYGAPFWGWGYATEAARAVLRAHFKAAADPVRSGYHSGNAGSRNVLTKLGFVPDGTEIQTVRSLGTQVATHKMRLTRVAFAEAA